MAERGLRVDGLRVNVGGKEILKGIDLTVEPGSVHALMGPNGSGKSTLAFAMSGHPRYDVTGGSVTLDGEELLGLSPDKRAKAGLFLSFQYPAAIPGVSVANFLRSARQAVHPDDLPPAKFRQLIFEKLDALDMDVALMSRYVNDGFSGGEKKRLEMLQLSVLAPKYAVLDETDSGLDVDALRAVCDSVAAMRATDAGKDTGFLIITHYPRILHYITPDRVHVMLDGKIVKSGDAQLADLIEREGYDALREEVAVAPPNAQPSERDAILGVGRRQLDGLVGRFGEGAVPLAARLDALARYEELPARGPARGRYWKHDLSSLDLSGHTTLPADGNEPDDLHTPDAVLASNLVYRQIDDRFICDARGGIVEPIDSARQRRVAAFERAFGRALDTRDDKFASLALAFQHGGAFIDIPAGMTVDEPMVVSYEARRTALFPYTLVRVGEGANATVVERIRSGATPDSRFFCGLSELVVEDGATLTYVVLEEADEHSRILVTRRAIVGAGARMHIRIADLGGLLCVDRLRVTTGGRDAEARLTGIFFAGGKQHVDLETEVVHAVGETRSHTTVKSAATGAGQGRYLGNIRIAAHANGSDASLRDDALLLGREAHIDSVPALEIASNDVKAFHGATVGSIDEDELFYAESRGIGRRDAERMIAAGFFEPAIAEFPTEPLREHLRREVERKLP